jgi:hypothetical protein
MVGMDMLAFVKKKKLGRGGIKAHFSFMEIFKSVKNRKKQKYNQRSLQVKILLDSVLTT